MNKMRYLRIGVALAVLAVIFICTFAHVPIGTLCALCPVGFVEIGVASGTVPWELLPGVLIVLAIVFLLGRVFCSWICPTSLLRNIFGGRKPRGLTGRTGECIGCSAVGASLEKGGCKSESAHSSKTCASDNLTVAAPCACDGSATNGQGACADLTTSKQRVRNNLAAQGIVLAVLLIVSFVVHFPVFCLLCPIGLVFGSMFAVSRLFITWQPGWEIIVFPAMLFLELFVLRKWCSAICPLGFFFGLMAKARSKISFLPQIRVNKKTCIHGEGCEVCATVCPEDICAPVPGSTDLQDCTLCLDCKEHCPTKSIKL